MFGWSKKGFLLNFVVTLSRAATKVYKADITEVPGSESGVTGTIIVFTPEADNPRSANYSIAYGGFVTNTEECEGCSVHIHSGKSCDSKETQEGHYFVDPVVVDPWNDETVYNSDSDGAATFYGMVKMGTDNVIGRTFLVHKPDGGRIGCGVLEEVAQSDTMISSIGETDESGVGGFLTAYQVDSSDKICYHGTGSGLERNLAKHAGTHIHKGVSCESKEARMGHYYDSEAYMVDPWNVLGYKTTDAEGNAEYAACVETGVSDYPGKTFLVHASDGHVVGCGVMRKDAEDETSASSDTDDETSESTVRLSIFGFRTMVVFVLGLTLFP